jgi:hypothetical protein
MTDSHRSIALIDKRPFFEKALCHGVKTGLITPDIWQTIITDGAKGSVQVAGYFGGSHLHAELDNARKRVVHLVSLYLENLCGEDLSKAAISLRENTFLSHSRGGNEMLKKLHEMPESGFFGGIKGQELKDFQDERTLKKPLSLSAYRKEFQRRQDNAATMLAARWFAQDFGLPKAELDLVYAESVIRTAILMRHVALHKFPTRQLFAKTIEKLRSEAQAAGKFELAKNSLADVPAEFRVIANRVKRQIEKHDAPLILEAALTLDAALNGLEPGYFLIESGLEEVDELDGFISREWQQLTKGKEDPYSRLTLFMCLAARVNPKTSLTEREARALIKAVQDHGFDEAVVPSLITESAPFELKQDLLAMWENEFFPEAKKYLQDDSDGGSRDALRFLMDNCNISKAPAARIKKQVA